MFSWKGASANWHETVPEAKNWLWSLIVFLPPDDSDDDREVNRKVRQVRQAASKAVSKQREMILGGGSEDEEREEEEQAFVDSKCTIQLLGTLSRAHTVGHLSELLFPFDFLRPDIFKRGPWPVILKIITGEQQFLIFITN